MRHLAFVGDFVGPLSIVVRVNPSPGVVADGSEDKRVLISKFTGEDPDVPQMGALLNVSLDEL